MPLIHNATGRLWVAYEGPAGRHEVMFRYAEGVEPADAVTSAASVCNAMKAFLSSDTAFVDARWSERLTVVSFPVTWTPISGTSSDTLIPENYPNFVTWVGRSSDGVRVRWTLNGVPLEPDSDYRLPASSTAVSAVLTALRTASPSIVTASRLVPIINNYADTGCNAYFQRKRRRSS